ncbi:hypothetical protein SAMN04488589_1848 [Methanolobus vulcani]|uniref:Uncharacterized protein n=1 Tax=Methanolobus vulcani TaxID=38026 RepID=A0A7Z7FCU2_9EURY|nr:hypothetical protein [Methanolobus vulcani]SDF96608.1 hypothetical protein SAMN04488589_1848 [Methanolobus vulcani]
MKMIDHEFIPKEFVFADIWISDEIHTILSFDQLLNIIKEHFSNYSYNKEKKRIMLRNNFAMKIITIKFATENKFSLEFVRYYHRFYAAYIAIALIASFIVEFSTPGVKPGFFALVIFLIPIPLIWMVFETVRGIKGIKEFDYSKEAERLYFEILNAVKEKENRLNLAEDTNNS